MTTPTEDVLARARFLVECSASDEPEGQRALLRALGLAMKSEESSFDPAHGFARILEASDAHHEVRLKVDGTWWIGSTAEEDLVVTWTESGRPSLSELLDAIPKTFSSAKIGRLIAEIRALEIE